MALSSRAVAARARRVARAVNGLQTTREVIGRVESGMSLFAVTRGQISMIDVIMHCVEELGAAEVSVWTWCIAEYEVEAFERLLASRQITAATLVVDRSAEQRNVELLDRWRDRFGASSVKICMNHAKLATISNGAMRLLARGSMNLNFNPRFEQFDLSEGDPAFDLVREIESEIPVLPRLASRRAADDASGILDAWSANDLQPFEGVTVWQK